MKFTYSKYSSPNLELLIKVEKDKDPWFPITFASPFAHPNFVLLSTPVHHTAKTLPST